jgi:hypothetical protein
VPVKGGTVDNYSVSNPPRFSQLSPFEEVTKLPPGGYGEIARVLSPKLGVVVEIWGMAWGKEKKAPSNNLLSA